MTDAQETALAGLLMALMHARNLSVAHLAVRGGLSRNTIMYILSGKTIRPKPRTLSALARVLAEDPWTRELDTAIMTENERLLAAAAGYATPTARETLTHLELALYYRLASRVRARAWLETIEALSALPPAAVRAIPARLQDAGSTVTDSTDGGC